MARKEDKTTIQVSIDLRNALVILKMQEKMESIEEAVQKLYDNYTKEEG